MIYRHCIPLYTLNNINLLGGWMSGVSGRTTWLPTITTDVSLLKDRLSKSFCQHHGRVKVVLDVVTIDQGVYTVLNKVTIPFRTWTVYKVQIVYEILGNDFLFERWLRSDSYLPFFQVTVTRLKISFIVWYRDKSSNQSIYLWFFYRRIFQTVMNSLSFYHFNVSTNKMSLGVEDKE